MKLRLGLVFIVLGSLAPSAGSYVPLRTPDGVALQWRRGCPAFTVVASGGEGLPAEQLAELIERSRQAWQGGPDGCGQLPVEVIGEGPDGDIAYDGASRLLWRDRDHCTRPGSASDEVCLSPNAAAVTTVFYYERGDRAGELVEADMEINGAFTFGTNSEPDRVDLLATLTHELGHALGLEHTCETIPGRAPMIDSAGVPVPPCFPLGALPETVRAATMFPYQAPGDVETRTPLPDERGAVCGLYREHAGTCAETGPGCGCAGAGGASALTTVLLLIALWWLRFATRPAWRCPPRSSASRGST